VLAPLVLSIKVYVTALQQFNMAGCHVINGITFMLIVREIGQLVSNIEFFS